MRRHFNHFAQKIFRGHRVIVTLTLCLFGLCMIQAVKKKDNRVYLVHADRLKYDVYVNPDAQILNGKVHFSHQGAELFCDSAHFYEASNSFEAFGHVKMVQGDTLKLLSDYAYYDGNDQMAEARNHVILYHRQSRLETDSLNYDRLYGIGYFFDKGTMYDKTSVLRSDWGEYSTATRVAKFFYQVDLTDEQYHLTSDTLYYNTATSEAHTIGPSDVVSGNSRIYTEDGYYNTSTEQSRMYGRSVLRNQGRSMVGDSVFHDNKTGESRAYAHVIYVDSVNKNMLTANYCYHNNMTGYAMATDSAVVIDFSQTDSLYMHADTLKLFTFNINTDSVYREIHAYNKMRAYRRDVQAVADSLVYNTLDSCMTMYKDPIVWTNNQQLLGEVIRVWMKDSTIHKAHVDGQALSVEQLSDTIHYNQITSKEMFAYFHKGEIYETDANDNVQIIYYPIDESDSTLIGLNYTETSKLKIFMENRKMRRIWMPKAEGTLYPMTQIPSQKKFLPNYAWFAEIRPVDKEDIFVYRGKRAGTELKVVKRKSAPVQYLKGKDHDNE